jgi:hydrogenase nickel incorporation protein HypB
MHRVADEHGIVANILEANDELGHHNREHFNEAGLLAINLMSAPGAGKTTLLEKTLERLSNLHRVSFVIEGDMVGELDAERLRKIGASVAQISTGKACHLDSKMVAKVLHHQNLKDTDFVFIENVGNLVCPAEFFLGEHLRVVLLSVTEGDDKPVKYPVIFHKCDAVVFTKCDLLPHVAFDLSRAVHHVRALNASAKVFEISTVNGAGLEEWMSWLSSQLIQQRNKQYAAAQG